MGRCIRNNIETYQDDADSFRLGLDGLFRVENHLFDPFAKCIGTDTCRDKEEIDAEASCMNESNNWNCYETDGTSKTNSNKERNVFNKGHFDETKNEWVSDPKMCQSTQACRKEVDVDAELQCVTRPDNHSCWEITGETMKVSDNNRLYVYSKPDPSSTEYLMRDEKDGFYNANCTLYPNICRTEQQATSELARISAMKEEAARRVSAAMKVEADRVAAMKVEADRVAAIKAEADDAIELACGWIIDNDAIWDKQGVPISTNCDVNNTNANFKKVNTYNAVRPKMLYDAARCVQSKGAPELETGTVAETEEGVFCPVNCIYGEWGNWSACSVSCGEGTKTQNRSVTPSANGGSDACDHVQNTKDCSQTACVTEQPRCNGSDYSTVYTAEAVNASKINYNKSAGHKNVWNSSDFSTNADYCNTKITKTFSKKATSKCLNPEPTKVETRQNTIQCRDDPEGLQDVRRLIPYHASKQGNALPDLDSPLYSVININRNSATLHLESSYAGGVYKWIVVPVNARPTVDIDFMYNRKLHNIFIGMYAQQKIEPPEHIDFGIVQVGNPQIYNASIKNLQPGTQYRIDMHFQSGQRRIFYRHFANFTTL
jgi:hypothetical protein